MPTFKLKDLMIDVVPAERETELAQFQQWHCIRFHSCLMIISDCHRFETKCGGYRTFDPCRLFVSDWCHLIRTTQVFLEAVECAGGTIWPEIEYLKIDPREFAMVREQLMVAVQGIEAAEKLAAEGMTPKTLEEVDLLRGKLKEAMTELDAMAKDMG